MVKVFSIISLISLSVCSISKADQTNGGVNRRPSASDCTAAIIVADSSLIGPIGQQIAAINSATSACTTDANKELYNTLATPCGDVAAANLGSEGRAQVRACWLRAIEYIHAIEAVKSDQI